MTMNEQRRRKYRMDRTTESDVIAFTPEALNALALGLSEAEILKAIADAVRS